MKLQLKTNHDITFSAPNIRYVDAGIMKWYIIKHGECSYPSALSAYDWEMAQEETQSHWKPSEEQMEALLWCTAHLGGADYRVLAELYEHLKKLM